MAAPATGCGAPPPLFWYQGFEQRENRSGLAGSFGFFRSRFRCELLSRQEWSSALRLGLPRLVARLRVGQSNGKMPGSTRDSNLRIRWLVSLSGVAERKGFEPLIQLSPYGALAKHCLQPLGHLSGADLMTRIHGQGQTRRRVPRADMARSTSGNRSKPHLTDFAEVIS